MQHGSNISLLGNITKNTFLLTIFNLRSIIKSNKRGGFINGRGWFEKGGVSPELMDLFNYIQENGADFMIEKTNPRNQRKITSINEAVNKYLATLD